MHYTLTPRGNALLTAFMGVVLLICFMTGNGPSEAVIAGFSVGGLAAGLLQKTALTQDAPRFQAAATALQVRQALIASTPGKLSVALLWLAGLALILLIVYGGEHASVQTIVGSYAAFSFVREATVLPSLFKLSQNIDQR